MYSVEEIKQTIVDIISADVNEDKKRRELYDLILPVIKAQEGKQVTRRIETSVRKVLPDDTLVSYSSDAGMYHLYIWGKTLGLTYDTRVSFLLGYHWSGEKEIVSVEKFADYNACNGWAASERIADGEKILNDPYQILFMAHAERDLREMEAIHAELFDTPDNHARYAIERAFGRLK